MAIVVVLCIAVLPLALADSELTSGAKAGTRVDQAVVTITGAGRAVTVPRSFLGLSTEYWTLPLWAPQFPLLERMINLLQPPGSGPMVLRIGGDSADHSFWETSLKPLPAWVFQVTPRWTQELSALVAGTGSKLILDLNLVTGSAATAADWARAAVRGLPAGSISGFEIGNEPDIYSRWYWTHGPKNARIAVDQLPGSMTLSRYLADFFAYRRALARVAPGIPLIGPAIAHPGQHADWIARLISDGRGSLSAISAHRYPYSACAKPWWSGYPTVARVLGERGTAGLAQGVARGIALAHRAGLPFRMTELNSVTCGGRRGVSNTFATALWAPDALFELMRAGVDGVNMHVRDAINAPFAFTSDGVWARPLLYGLVTFTRMLGPGAQLVPATTHTDPAARLKVWAVRVAGRTLHVLLIDKGGSPVSVQLRLPASGAATVEWLLARSPQATAGVSLAGQHLGPDGQWIGAPVIKRLAARNHRYELQLPPYSAAIVSVRTSPRPAVPVSGARRVVADRPRPRAIQRRAGRRTAHGRIA